MPLIITIISRTRHRIPTKHTRSRTRIHEKVNTKTSTVSCLPAIHGDIIRCRPSSIYKATTKITILNTILIRVTSPRRCLNNVTQVLVLIRAALGWVWPARMERRV